MTTKLIWILIFLILYCSYCVYIGFKVAPNNKTASDHFIARRKLPALLFLFTATAASFSGSVFLVLPGLIFR